MNFGVSAAINQHDSRLCVVRNSSSHKARHNAAYANNAIQNIVTATLEPGSTGIGSII